MTVRPSAAFACAFQGDFRDDLAFVILPSHPKLHASETYALTLHSFCHAGAADIMQTLTNGHEFRLVCRVILSHNRTAVCKHPSVLPVSWLRPYNVIQFIFFHLLTRAFTVFGAKLANGSRQLYQSTCKLASEVLDRQPICDTMGVTMQMTAQALPQPRTTHSLPMGAAR